MPRPGQGPEDRGKDLGPRGNPGRLRGCSPGSLAIGATWCPTIHRKNEVGGPSACRQLQEGPRLL